MNAQLFLFRSRVLLISTIFLIASCDKGGEDPRPLSCPESDALNFTESDGLVIVEFEAVPDRSAIGDWDFRNDFAAYEGEGFLYWAGEDHFSQPGNSTLGYEIEISNPGTYRFIYSGYIALGESTTESNDLWLRFADASDFYGFRENDDSYVYPKGTDKSPNPEGASRDGWLKVYMNQLNEWTYTAKTSDNDAHDIYVEFDNPGTYLMEISGRSEGFAIDRAVIYKEEGNFADLGNRAKRKEAFEVLDGSDATCP
ncbi:hypothetical protein [Marivirga sericea]|nr:hypothetical protein [Marivirga sericea]